MSDTKYLAFVGTNSVRGSRGIYSVAIDGACAAAEIVATHPAYNAGAMTLGANDRVYAGVEGMTFRGLADGGVTGYAFDKRTGRLTEVGAARSHGQRTCCVSIDRAAQNLYACNFYQGTMSMFALDDNGAPQPARCVVQGRDVPGAHKALHAVCAIQDRYAGVISLTECALIIYAADDGRRITSYAFPGKPFCRYLESCGDCLYALMQDPGDVYVFRNRLDADGSIEMIQKISVLQKPIKGHYGTTTIRATPNGQLMLAATRSTNTMTVYHILQDGRLEIGNVVTLPGQTPRDFGISSDGTLVVSALQRSDEICIHTIDYARATLVDTGVKVAIPSPAAVAVYGKYCRCQQEAM